MNNILVFGAGNLGSRIGSLWKRKYEGSNVYAVTKSLSRHSTLSDSNMIPYTLEQEIPVARHVVFSIPPKDKYVQLLEKALSHWDRSGSFLFISSTSIYMESQCREVTEDSLLNIEHKLFPAEELVRNESGNILRLAGLYDSDRGPHKYLKKNLKMRASKNSPLNLIHTDDAAKLALKVLESEFVSKSFMGCDNSPLKKEDFAKIVLGENYRDVVYSSEEDSGKLCSNIWTCETLSWRPDWISFQSWYQTQMSCVK